MKNRILYTLLVFFNLSTYAQNDTTIYLIARNTGEKVLANNDTIRVFGFAESLGEHPTIPGPTIIVNEGDSVHTDLWNVSQGAPHTIHLHGLDVDQQNDGVPHLSFDVPHMEHGKYHFKAPHAGTYLYHCHVVSTIHVQAGMYGMIIVKPTDGSNTTWDDGYSFTNDNSYFMSEIDTIWHRDSILLHDHDTSVAIHEVELPIYDPQFFLVNGFSDQQIESNNMIFKSSIEQVDYTRLANLGYMGNRVIFPKELNARIISTDGRPMLSEEISDTVYVYPGERYGILTKPTIEFEDEISYEYINMNTGIVENIQYVPVKVEGYNVVVEDIEKKFNLMVSPNPFNNDLNISFELKEKRNVKIKVLDINGITVFDNPYKIFAKGKRSVNLSNKIDSKGVYFVQLIVDGISSTVVKVIKEE